MSETKFTPGPWTLQTVQTVVGSCHKIGPFPGPMNRPETHACVYSDNINPDDADRGDPRAVELLANARLIASAPDLLAALKDLLEPDAVGPEQAIENAIAVIAKAEGR